ncbi:MAG: nitronate monooxygenase, partial [Beijerinckiaceae bacterium]|nr:nitronate monooxygenase [Beijerinckiaceae bacterium]
MDITARYSVFCRRFGLRLPILLAPMAGVPAPALSIAVATAGGMGGCGALMLAPDAIRAWQEGFHAASNGASLINLWVPDPPPARDAEHEARLRDFLSGFGPAVSPQAGDASLQPFAAQCEALIAARPAAASSIMGLFPPAMVERLKAAGIAWFATVTTVAEARAAQAAGADVLVAQGAEAGGHRGAFDAALAERQAVGLMAL